MMALQYKKHNVLVVALLCLVGLAGCSQGLPRAETVNVSPWSSFDEAKTAFEQIQLHQTTRQQLLDIGFDPYVTPNTRILTYLDLLSRFVPNESIRLEQLDEGVRRCLGVRERCSGYVVAPESVQSQREGNMFADMFNFKRHTVDTGWSFNALIVMQDDLVVYKLWGGTPRIHTMRKQQQPLGPLQDSGGILRDAVLP